MKIEPQEATFDIFDALRHTPSSQSELLLHSGSRLALLNPTHNWEKLHGINMQSVLTVEIK